MKNCIERIVTIATPLKTIMRTRTTMMTLTTTTLLGASLLAGCGGGGSQGGATTGGLRSATPTQPIQAPAIDMTETAPSSESVESTSVNAEETTAEGAADPDDSADITRGASKNWVSRLNVQWPKNLNANDKATVYGVLEWYDKEKGKWKGFSGEMTLTIRDNNGNIVNNSVPKQLSGADGKFSFSFTPPGKVKDYRKVWVTFVGNSEFKTSTEGGSYTLR